MDLEDQAERERSRRLVAVVLVVVVVLAVVGFLLLRSMVTDGEIEYRDPETGEELDSPLPR